MYSNRICNILIKTDSWTSGKVSVVGNSLTLGLILKHITALIEVLNLSAIKGYLVFRFATGSDKGSVKL
jgi:hypothetical protein